MITNFIPCVVYKPFVYEANTRDRRDERTAVET